MERAAEPIAYELAVFPWRSRVRLLPFLPHNQVLELAKIYAAAAIYLDLSLHEGFGMQVVEAMSCGTPVVCSKRGALPEVAGNAALLVDPDCVEQIASQVNRILCEPGLASSLRIKAQEQARKYDWRNTAGVIAGCVAQC